MFYFIIIQAMCRYTPPQYLFNKSSTYYLLFILDDDGLSLSEYLSDLDRISRFSVGKLM